MNKNQLPAEVAAKYELVDWVGGHRQIFGKHGVVDLQTITLARADKLFRDGFKKLKLKSKPPKGGEEKK